MPQGRFKIPIREMIQDNENNRQVHIVFEMKQVVLNEDKVPLIDGPLICCPLVPK